MHIIYDKMTKMPITGCLEKVQEKSWVVEITKG